MVGVQVWETVVYSETHQEHLYFLAVSAECEGLGKYGNHSNVPRYRA